MIPVPESVLAYFHQPGVQTAVDLLLSGKEPKVPGSLRWDEASSFYRACLAARQVPAEFAIFLEALWQSVWKETPSGWLPRAPSDPARPDLAIGITNIWEQACFSRRFERPGCALELSVYLSTDGGLQLGVLLYDEDENVLLNAGLLGGWRQEGDFDTYWTQEEIVPLAATVSPAAFEHWTRQAWRAIASAMDGL